MTITLGNFIGWALTLATAPVVIISIIGWPIFLINEHFRRQRLNRMDQIRNFNRELEEMEYYNEIHYGHQ